MNSLHTDARSSWSIFLGEVCKYLHLIWLLYWKQIVLWKLWHCCVYLSIFDWGIGILAPPLLKSTKSWLIRFIFTQCVGNSLLSMIVGLKFLGRNFHSLVRDIGYMHDIIQDWSFKKETYISWGEVYDIAYAQHDASFRSF